MGGNKGKKDGQMADKQKNLARLVESGVVAVVRVPDAGQLIRLAEALEKGGVTNIEFTMTTPGALKMMEEAAATFGDRILLGAGTVLDGETARSAILAGAEYVVGPNLNLDMIRMCRRYDKIVVPGALTPTEVLAAWEAGADLVKIFPVSAVGGPGYVKGLLAPLPQVKLLPTGGVDATNAAEFIRAGAVAIGVGGKLVDKKLIAEGRFDVITENARQLLRAVAGARQ